MSQIFTTLFELFFNSKSAPSKKVKDGLKVVAIAGLLVYIGERVVGLVGYFELSRRLAILKSLHEAESRGISLDPGLTLLYQEAAKDLAQISGGIVSISELPAKLLPTVYLSTHNVLMFLSGALVWLFFLVFAAIHEYKAKSIWSVVTLLSLASVMVIAVLFGMIGLSVVPVIRSPWVNLVIGNVAQLFLLGVLAKLRRS